MRILLLLFTIVLAACAAVHVPGRWEATGYLLGGFQRDDRASENPGVRDRGMGGAEFGVQPPGLPFAMELGFRQSRGSSDQANETYAVQLSETSVGAVQRYRLGELPLYLKPGLGWSLLYVEKDHDSATQPDCNEADFEDGPYAALGLEWHGRNGLRLGVEYRYVLDEVLDFGEHKLDHHQVALTFGWRF